MRIALIGSAPASVGLGPYRDVTHQQYIDSRPVLEMSHAPFASDNWEIWGCSPGVYGVAERMTRWFELHRWEPGQTWFSPEYCDFLRAFRGTLYTTEVIPELKSSVRLPRERIVEEFGPYFLTSSLSFMFAMAIFAIEDDRAGRTKVGEEDQIGLWGVDMAACPHPDTKVLTADLRWMRAGDLELGQKIMAFDEEPQPNGDSTQKRRWRVAEVVRNDRIRKPCYKLTLEDGRELICSDEHKWLTYAENEARWVMAKDLVTPHHRADRPTRIIKLCDVWEEDRTRDGGYLAAAVDGEGHLTQKLREEDWAMLRVGFAQRDNPMSVEVLAAAARLGFEFGVDARHDGANGDTVKYTLRGGRSKTMEFLGRVRPHRLLGKFNGEHLGILQKQDTVAVIAAEFIGEQEVVGLTTSTGTFIAEGLATHNTEEYGYQRAGCQFFMREAQRRGIGVVLPPESDLHRPMPMYGVSEWTHAHIKNLARWKELDARKRSAEQQAAAKQAEAQFLAGAMDNMDYMIKTWIVNDTSAIVPVGETGKQVMYLPPKDNRKAVPSGDDDYSWARAKHARSSMADLAESIIDNPLAQRLT